MPSRGGSVGAVGREAALKTVVFCLLLTAVIGAGARADEVRMNQVQVIGTHNSYHLAPSAALLKVIGKMKAEWRGALDYTHRPLAEQFGKLGVRQIELDVFADPRGGLYSNPKLAALGGGDGDPGGDLAKPGMKVLHIQDLDFRTTVPTLKGALSQVREWSKLHPRHVPMMILLELKEDRPSALLVQPVPFDRAQLEALEKEILEVFEKAEIILPDDVRGGAKTLREAVLTNGWPTLEAARGKVMFALDNGGALRDRYLEGNPSLQGRVMFASVGENDPGAAFFKLNDPVGGFETIRRLVKAGFIVRTRADAGTAEARDNAGARRDKALASGAQFVSTDYPEADSRLSAYRVGFDGGAAVRANPVSGSGLSVAE